MEKTVCELFAGVGGFRCGLNHIKEIKDLKKKETWNTVWFNQWEPGKKNQWAHACYVRRFGTSLDLNDEDTTNLDIAKVDKKSIPNHSLLVGGFPCQDYSVARGLNGEKGIEGKKGVLWWSIYNILREKGTPFVLLENVDRLVKSPSKQRGRDFGVILSCFAKEGYTVEWRIINAAEYGAAQKRRRTFIFAYKNTSKYAASVWKRDDDKTALAVINYVGIFAKAFPQEEIKLGNVRTATLNSDVVEVSDLFKFEFSNSGVMHLGKIYTCKTNPIKEKPLTLGQILENKEVDNKFFISDSKLYYTSHEINKSDETISDLPKEQRQTWQYIKGAKKRLRVAKNGHRYFFSEGPISLVDDWKSPARTMLTSEGAFNRSTHLVKDKKTGRIRLLTPIEAERIQGFPDDWTKECLVHGEIVNMPERTRFFCMGNALVVDVVARIERELSMIIEKE